MIIYHVSPLFQDYTGNAILFIGILAVLASDLLQDKILAL